MRMAQIFLLAVLGWLALSSYSACAQQPAPPEPAATPTPSAENNYGYPDIESLRDPGSSAKLFPEQPAATPDPTLQNAQNARGAGRRGGRGAARTHGSGRRRDVLAQQADADPLQVRVAYRLAKTVAMARDPGLAELLQRADGAGTDPEKRAFLKQYYVRLYAEVAKVDPSPEMKKHLDALKQVSQTRYEPKRREVGGEEDIVLGGGGRRGGGRRR